MQEPPVWYPTSMTNMNTEMLKEGKGHHIELGVLKVLEAVIADCPHTGEWTLFALSKVFSGAPFLSQTPFNSSP